MKYLLSLLLLFLFCACENPLGSGSEADSEFNPIPGNGGGGSGSDTTAPTAVGSVTFASNDSANDRSPTVTWSASPGSDDSGSWSYQIAIGYDNEDNGFGSDDLDNLVAWTTLSGGSTTTSYQIVDGVNGFSFDGVFDKEHYVSVRLIDGAGNTSSATSSAAWYTFNPNKLSGVTIWLDASDTSTLYTDSSCTTSVTTNNDPIGCWQDKSTAANNATASGADRPLYSSAAAVMFTGTATNNNTGECLDVTSMDAQSQYLVLENAQNSSSGLHGLLGNSDQNKYLFLSTSQGYAVSFDGTVGDQGRFAINGDAFSGYGTNIGSNLSSAEQIFSGEFQNAQSGWVNIGCFNHSSGPKNYRANFDLKEIITLSGTLSTSEKEELEGYLACKWDLRSSLNAAHPYYNANPSTDDGCP